MVALASGLRCGGSMRCRKLDTCLGTGRFGSFVGGGRILQDGGGGICHGIATSRRPTCGNRTSDPRGLEEHFDNGLSWCGSGRLRARQAACPGEVAFSLNVCPVFASGDDTGCGFVLNSAIRLRLHYMRDHDSSFGSTIIRNLATSQTVRSARSVS
jgi:hypothetical protein